MLEQKIAKSKEHYDNLKDDYIKVFSTSEGKRVLVDLSRSGFINKSTFQPGDPYITARNEGMRTAVLHIIDMSKREKESTKEKTQAVT